MINWKLILLLFSGLELFPQSLSDKELKFAIAEYQKMMLTPDYLALDANSKDFATKIYPAVMSPDINTPEKFKDWLIKNISATQFKSVDEALAQFEKAVALQENLERDYKVLYEYISRADSAQISKILEPERYRPE